MPRGSGLRTRRSAATAPKSVTNGSDGAHPRIERVAEQDGRGQGGQGQRVHRGRAQRLAAPVDRNGSGRLRQFQGSALP